MAGSTTGGDHLSMRQHTRHVPATSLDHIIGCLQKWLLASQLYSHCRLSSTILLHCIWT